LLVGDVGYNTIEEIDVVVRGGNYGWNIKEGSMVTPWSQGRDTHSLIDPIYEYTHSECKKISKHSNSCAITGVRRTRDGGIIFSDYSGFVTKIVGHNIATQVIDDYIKGMGSDSQGNIYLLTSVHAGPQETTGKVVRITI
jgi:hypothetical protein